jgi:acyl-CoA reductase-like NAD-dependent aldehyde dehydrogenase
MYTDLGLFIDGQWLNGQGRKGEDVINPATAKTLAHLPHASTADLEAALGAAEKGFAIWKATSAYDRAQILRKAADLLRARREHVAKVMVQEQVRSTRKRAARSSSRLMSSTGTPKKAAAPMAASFPAAAKACASS